MDLSAACKKLGSFRHVQLGVFLHELKLYFNLAVMVRGFILPLADRLHQSSHENRIAAKLLNGDDSAIRRDRKEDTSHSLDIRLACQFRIFRRHAVLEFARIGLGLRGL